MPKYDYEFPCIVVDGDRRIVADEAAWCELTQLETEYHDAITAWEAGGRASPRPRHPVICVIGDVFEDWSGPIYTTDGGELCVGDLYYGVPVRMVNVRRRLLRRVDDLQNLRFVCETAFPENVARVRPGGEIVQPGEKAACWINHNRRPNLLIITPDQQL
jgi:hypothetical protein